jgi:hypothetical protein
MKQITINRQIFGKSNSRAKVQQIGKEMEAREPVCLLAASDNLL